MPYLYCRGSSRSRLRSRLFRRHVIRARRWRDLRDAKPQPQLSPGNCPGPSTSRPSQMDCQTVRCNSEDSRPRSLPAIRQRFAPLPLPIFPPRGRLGTQQTMFRPHRDSQQLWAATAPRFRRRNSSFLKAISWVWIRRRFWYAVNYLIIKLNEIIRKKMNSWE